MNFHRISAAAAAKSVAGLAGLDPTGRMTEADVLRIGEGADTLRVTRWQGPVLVGSAVLVIRAVNGVAWVDAVAGTGEGMTEALHHVGQEWGRRHGCAFISCQTRRRGLRAQLKKQGWADSGWIMKAPIQ